MTPPQDPARTAPPMGFWEAFGPRSRASGVPLAASAGAAAGVVVGYVIGDIELNRNWIQPGSSVHMASAVAGALGGGLGWLIGAIAGMAVYRHLPPASRKETRGLAIAAVGVLGAAALLAAVMVSLQDPFEDPRMFRLHRLIWIDAGLAAATLLLLAIRRWPPVLTIGALTVVGVTAAVLAVSQFLPFIAGCAPVRSGACIVDS